MKRDQVNSPSNMTVLIVGGGIGGLSVALALQRNGIKAHVFERARQFREVGSGMILSSNDVEIFKKKSFYVNHSRSAQAIVSIVIRLRNYVSSKRCAVLKNGWPSSLEP